jgi:tRNA (adenine57-N1/adenine58-N1)-methyltransferase
MKNLKKSHLEIYVETKLKDVTTGIDEKNLDAIILDIPNPWDAIKHAYKALKPGGYICTYSPLTSQVENSIKEIKKLNFIEIKTIENIQREMVVTEKGIRPKFNMLGHTGYLSFARKVLL